MPDPPVQQCTTQACLTKTILNTGNAINALDEYRQMAINLQESGASLHDFADEITVLNTIENLAHLGQRLHLDRLGFKGDGGRALAFTDSDKQRHLDACRKLNAPEHS